MEWLKDITQQYLADSNKFINGFNHSIRIENYFTGLFLADEFELNILRERICSSIYGIEEGIYNDERFKKLSKSSKFHFAKTLIKMENHYYLLDMKNTVTNLLDSVKL